jgi:hypothetical protein
VSSQGDGGSEGGGEELLGGSELASGSVGKERGDGDANKGVEGAPDQVEGGDFVGEEFDGEERCAGGDDWPGFEEFEGRREWDVSEAGQESEDGDCGVDVESCGEGDCGKQSEELRERELVEVEHGAGFGSVGANSINES